MNKTLLLILFAALIVGAAFLAISRDWQAPMVKLTDAAYVNHSVIAAATDNRGLGEICYYLDGEIDGQSCVNTAGATSYELTVDLSELVDGAHEVCVVVEDANPYFPNRVNQCQSYVLDKVAPKAVLESATRYMQRGGGAAVFVSTPERETNIRLTVGDHQFRFVSNEEGTRHFAVFAHPHDVEVADFKPMVEIEDLAGNIRRLLIGTVTKDRTFSKDILNIPHAFIEKKSLEMLNKEGAGKEAFLEMNRTTRIENRAKIKTLLSSAQSREPLWNGAFYRNLGAPKAQHAEHRTYLLDKVEIDQQTHYGIDIAGLAKMPIKAANDGVVIFAEYLGIYGNCVIIDHGGHVYTMYAHLSQMDVSPGQTVSNGQDLGRSGNTGMAGGDHLHYATYINDIPVEPSEWFDPAWLQTRIDDIYKDFKSAE
ncbi:MAG: peptidoglycan DD-metalloendopeptidase family protein [Desulfuromonadales bacterium]|nr:peptidoglycan DD-metalloendopeptidase family protein [Desulfuromonadales bacterium]